MLLEKKTKRKKSILKKTSNLEAGYLGSQPKSSIVVDSNYNLKNLAEVRSDWMIKIGLGLSYTMVIVFLVYKLLV